VSRRKYATDAERREAGRLRARAWYRANRARAIARAAEWKRANPEKAHEQEKRAWQKRKHIDNGRRKLPIIRRLRDVTAERIGIRKVA
jgi:hypothetical protein